MAEAEFKNAPMSPFFVLVTGVTLAIPVIWAVMIFTVGHGIWKTSLAVIAGFAVTVALIWLYLRPAGYTVDDERVTVRWPLRKLVLKRSEIENARTLDRAMLRRDFGWSARVGVGGLFGTFGLLWTTKRGWMSAYATTTNDWVLLERAGGWPLLISPERPDDFVRALKPR
jgi:Bacterial PH domain